MKAKKIWNYFCRALPFLCIAALLLALIFYPHPTESEATKKRVVRIWNVDTFEGGKGSRTAFLREVALKTEKKRTSVYYLVSSFTPEGAEEAYAKGNRPDVLSFGVGLSAYAENSLPLSRRFAGGETDAGCLAYPWCRGGYYLFSLSEDFGGEGSTVISKGGSNLVSVAAAYAQIKGEEVDSTAAYVNFLNGKFRYLLGTQRDVCRFEARGKTVYTKPLNDFCDLYQYISVLSAEKRADCDAFLDELLSKNVQEQLSRIGMQPCEGDENGRTVSVFSSHEALENLAELARGGESGKNLDKYLKFI